VSVPIRAAAVVAAAVVLCSAAGFSVGLTVDRDREPVPATAVPAEGSVEVGFARDMREHHAQAVTMSTLVRDATTDAEIRTLALDVLLTQQQQAGQLYGWISAWGLPQTSGDPPMRWMDTSSRNDPDAGEHGAGHTSDPAADTDPAPVGVARTPGMKMPGMASGADLARLARLRGKAAERLYLQLMIPHHEGGVAMARRAAEQAGQRQVRVLAEAMVAAQTAELAALRELLAARGGPLPDPGQ
jgi:uncharacterized protein (DUF305 family)